MVGRGEANADGRELDGLSVLLVEDESMICMMIEDMLLDLGCVVVGPATSLEQALSLAGDATADIAVLDVNLDGRPSDSVAERLAERGVPFVFATGYGEPGVSVPYRGRPILKKPFGERALAQALVDALRDGSGRGGGPRPSPGR